MKFVLASLAAVAFADMEMYQANTDFSSNDDSIVISQTSGVQNFTMLAAPMTYADPDPVQINNTQKFIIDGIWNIDASDLDYLYFVCHEASAPNVPVYWNYKYCDTTGENQCTSPTGTVPEMWSATMTFPVPSVVPSGWTYVVDVKGVSKSGEEWFVLHSEFQIPT